MKNVEGTKMFIKDIKYRLLLLKERGDEDDGRGKVVHKEGPNKRLKCTR
jgi:hypothetical protein